MRRGALLPALVLHVLGATAVADRGGFVIRSFHTDLDVEPKAALVVTERIEVDFSEPRHGIYRTIPVRYTDPIGYAYSLGFRLIDVVDEDGRAHQTKVDRGGSHVDIRIGSPNRTVRDRVVYIIRYRVPDALRHFPEHDELYWNVTGTEWGVPIERASATLRLPGGPETGWFELAGYTGGYGRREQAVTIDEREAGVAHWSTTSRLAPKEGLTIVATWPHGLVRFPGPVVRATRFLANNAILAVPVVAFILLWWRYRRKGRDPSDVRPIVVRYEPPEGVTPAELGTVIDEKVDLRDITATIVDLAVRGCLAIKVEEKEPLFGLFDREEITFERNAEEATGDLLPHERRILDGMFETGHRVELSDLKERFYVRLGGIRDALYDRVVERGYFDARPTRVRWLFVLLGIVAAVATLIGGVVLVEIPLRGGALPIAYIVPVVASLATLVVFVGFSGAMPRRTKSGVELRAWGLSFEEFIDRMESEKLEADRARNVFEALLPYAMALGVAATWARRFEGIYESGGGPAWFLGRRPMAGFSTTRFERSLSSVMSQAGASMASSPRSSGSSGSGGGFSGGGGGGGGGGSW